MSAAQLLQGGFQFLEGPVWNPTRQELLFSDIPANKIYRWKNGRVEVWRDGSNQANGNTLDRQGRLITCEHATRRVTRTELDGTIVPIATHYEGKRLNSPNDVCVRSDGAIYFSDPPYAVKPEDRELDFQGVYRIVGDRVELVERDFQKPNGLCFSPDEKTLYIADTERGVVMEGRAPSRPFAERGHDGAWPSKTFCKVERPDGIRTDRSGNLYVAAMKAVEIFNPAAQKTGEIELPERPANLAIGGIDGRTLFICARTGLYHASLRDL